MRLLRGEPLDALARDTGQAAGAVAGWREDFLACGQEGLKSHSAPVEEIGELAMDNDILRVLVEEVEHRPRRPRR